MLIYTSRRISNAYFLSSPLIDPHCESTLLYVSHKGFGTSCRFIDRGYGFSDLKLTPLDSAIALSLLSMVESYFGAPPLEAACATVYCYLKEAVC